CFSGHARDDAHPFPAFYPLSNYPQAWSAAALFAMIQAMVGIYPYAPLDLLLVDPHLPEWLPQITLTNLKVGKGRIDIRFYREKHGGSDYEILDVRGKLHRAASTEPLVARGHARRTYQRLSDEFHTGKIGGWNNAASVLTARSPALLLASGRRRRSLPPGTSPGRCLNAGACFHPGPGFQAWLYREAR